MVKFPLNNGQLLRAAQLLAGIASCGTLARSLTTMGAAWTLMDQWNYTEYQVCLLGGNAEHGRNNDYCCCREISQGHDSGPDSQQIEFTALLGMSVVLPSHIMSVKQSSSKIYDWRHVLTKEHVTEEILHDKRHFMADSLYDHLKNK
jgi:hypothetical protein